jgi:hypothetical protein
MPMLLWLMVRSGGTISATPRLRVSALKYLLPILNLQRNLNAESQSRRDAGTLEK